MRVYNSIDHARFDPTRRPAASAKISGFMPKRCSSGTWPRSRLGRARTPRSGRWPRCGAVDSTPTCSSSGQIAFSGKGVRYDNRALSARARATRRRTRGSRRGPLPRPARRRARDHARARPVPAALVGRAVRARDGREHGARHAAARERAGPGPSSSKTASRDGCCHRSARRRGRRPCASCSDDRAALAVWASGPARRPLASATRSRLKRCWRSTARALGLAAEPPAAHRGRRTAVIAPTEGRTVAGLIWRLARRPRAGADGDVVCPGSAGRRRRPGRRLGVTFSVQATCAFVLVILVVAPLPARSRVGDPRHVRAVVRGARHLRRLLALITGHAENDPLSLAPFVATGAMAAFELAARPPADASGASSCLAGGRVRARIAARGSCGPAGRRVRLDRLPRRPVRRRAGLQRAVCRCRGSTLRQRAPLRPAGDRRVRDRCSALVPLPSWDQAWLDVDRVRQHRRCRAGTRCGSSPRSTARGRWRRCWRSRCCATSPSIARRPIASSARRCSRSPCL